jgi:carbonic anhydrase/acetyltransferase-like protein (isoleucine patch superfamily)
VFGLTIREFEGLSPRIAEGAYVDPEALLIGDVRVEERAGIYPGAVLRADESTIEIGKGSFVLDLALIEAPSGCPVTIGENTIISHGAMIHGCTIGENCVIGIGAIVLERANVGDGCIIAAGSLVPPGMKIDPGSVCMGIPAKKMRSTTSDDFAKLKSEINHLKMKSARYRN